MKQVWYKRCKDDGWRGGILHGFFQDHVEYESGPGNFPVAIIQDGLDGCVYTPAATLVCFAAVPPGPTFQRQGR